VIPPDSPIDLALVIEEVVPDIQAADADEGDDGEGCEFCGEPLVDGDCDVCGRSL
jgi:hypothetical protein